MKEEGIEVTEALMEDIMHAKSIIREIYVFSAQFELLKSAEEKGMKVNLEEKRLLQNVVNSLLTQVKIINNSLPELIEKTPFFKELPTKSFKEQAGKQDIISLRYGHPSIEGSKQALLTIKRADKLRFLKELSFTEDSVKRLKKEYRMPKEQVEEFKKPSQYAKISNKLFSNISTQLMEKGYFKRIGGELRKSNLYFLSQTYISMAFFTSLIAFFVSIFILIFLLFFEFSLDSFLFIVRTTDPILKRLLYTFWIIFALPILTFLGFYYYPSTEKSSLAGKINQELPFVVIHMSAIAGSGIEPSKIFEIIVKSKEYPNTRKEIKKLLNEINIYGYDLVTALKNSARITSSKKLAELFKGLATTITSGGNLKEFLDKRSETLIFDYKLERENYTKTAETFMDIYITVVIAAPMMMTILLVVMGLVDLDLGISPKALSLLMVLGIALLNVIFLAFLHLKQPEA